MEGNQYTYYRGRKEQENKKYKIDGRRLVPKEGARVNNVELGWKKEGADSNK